MARYIKDFQIGADFQTIHNTLNQYLQSEGYEYQQYDGENVFKKGTGWLSNPTFFKFSYTENTVHMETWMKYAFFPGVFVGEFGLTGFVGSALKGAWKKRVGQVESILMSFYAMPTQSSNAQPQMGYTPTANSPYSSTSDEKTGLLNNDFEETQILNENNGGQAGTVYCSYCGALMPEGSVFCSSCGQKRVGNIAAQNNSAAQTYSDPRFNANTQSVPQPSVFASQPGIQLPPPGQFVSRKDFINNYAQPSLKKNIKSIAILCYVCVGATLLVSVLFNPLGIIDALVLLGLALGMHLGKSKVCAILILVLSIIECIFGIIVGSFPIWWLVAGISAVVTFNKIEKQYKQFLYR